MTRPGSTNYHRAAPLQGKGLGAGKGLPGGDLAGVLPTQTIFETNLATPESFNAIGLSIQKLNYILVSTEIPNDKQTTHSIWQPITQI